MYGKWWITTGVERVAKEKATVGSKSSELIGVAREANGDQASATFNTF